MTLRGLALLAVSAMLLNAAHPKKGIGQRPKGALQKPGEIQQPKGIQAIQKLDTDCEQRLRVAADALFEFDQATLSKDSEETLKVLGPMLKEKVANHAVSVEGHADAIGEEAYGQTLSEKRAKAVADWMVKDGFVKADKLAVKGFGRKRPLAPNNNPMGGDFPEGRQRNRRVEVVIHTCK